MAAADLINDARKYVGALVGEADDAMKDAIRAVQQVGYSIPNIKALTLPQAPGATQALTPAVLLPVDVVAPPTVPTFPTFQDISTFDAGSVPQLNVSVPTITLPSSPSQLAGFNEGAPSINTNIAFPDPPSALMNPVIEAPVLPTRAEPAKPQTLLPSFTATAPTGAPVAPDDLASDFDAAYRNAAPSTITMLNGQVDAFITKHNPRYFEQMGRVEDQLAKYHQGGTGLNPAVENAIYARAQGKNNAEARRVQDGAYKDAAARGFTLPTGALMAAQQQARQAAADNNAAAAREIVVMQAEMEQKNLQFAVTTSLNLRQTILSAALNYHQNLIGINGQALDYAKTVLSAMIEVYNAAVKGYGLRLDSFRAEASVYEVSLKAAMAGIEVYKAEIDALQALTNVDRAKVDVYRARIEVLGSLANVYRSQIDAVVGRTTLEKLKLEVFQSKVQAYTAQVQGKNAEWQGYASAIEGQAAVAKIYGTQVDAYGAQVNGYKAGIEAKSAAVQAAATTNEARARQYSAAMQGYSAVVQANGQVAQTKLESNRQQVLAYQVGAQTETARAQMQHSYYQTVATIAIRNAELNMKAQFEEIDAKRQYAKSIAQLGTANADVYSKAANAALSGMNSLAAETTSS